MKTQKVDYLHFAYNTSETLGNFTDYIENYLNNNPTKCIRGFFIASSLDLFSNLKELKRHNFIVKILINNDNFLSFDLTRQFDEKDKKNIRGKALLVKTSRPNIYLVYTNSDHRFVQYGLRRLFENFYPKVASVYLSSLNLKQILESIQEEYPGSELVARKVVAYSRIEEEFEIKGEKMFKLNHKKVRETEVKYTDEQYKKSFENAAKNNAWIDKINYTYYIVDDKKQGFKEYHSGHISRNGILKVYSNFQFFVNKVSPKIASISQELYTLFQNRSRLREEKLYSSKPLKVLYDYDVFNSVEENRKLITAIETLKNSSISLFHGNPYLHISLVDYLDGSSYEMWVLSSRELIIIPQLKASFASINRVLNHVFQKFMEGTVTEL